MLLKQENSRLKKEAEGHADALAKAREGYVESSIVDTKITELTKELADVKSASTSLEEKAKAAEKQAKDEREARDLALKEQAAKYDALEKVVVDSCHSILGKFLFVSIDLASPRAARVSVSNVPQML